MIDASLIGLSEVVILLDQQIDSAWEDYEQADKGNDNLNRSYYLGIARGLEQARANYRNVMNKVGWHKA